MLKVLQNIMILLFKSSTTEDTSVQTINQLNKEVLHLKSRITDSAHSLDESKNFIEILEDSLEESTRTIDALNLAISMQEADLVKAHEDKLVDIKKELSDKVEETNLWMQKSTRLQAQVTELEEEIEEALVSLKNFEVSLRKN